MILFFIEELRMNPRVQKVISIMQKDLCRELTLSEMARSVDVSPWWLGHLFKAETGTSPMRYFRSLRLEQAKELLETTFLSIKEIMDKIGVRDESHFIRDFKHGYGLPPLRYRYRHGRSSLSKREFVIAGQQDRP